MQKGKSENSLAKILNTKKNRLKRLALVFIFILILYVYGFGDYGIYRYFELRNQLHNLDDEITLLEEESRQLKHEAELMKKKDPEYLQRIAREKYGLVKSGEKIYKLVPKSDKR